MLTVRGTMSNAVIDRLRMKLKYSATVRKAAEQMWAVVEKGIAFEVPASLSTDDNTTKAILCLQEMHPDCPVSMLQSRVVVIGHVKTAQGVSNQAWEMLEQGGYFPDAQKAANAEAFLSQQERFMRRTLTGLEGGHEEHDVDALVAKAQAEQAARDAIVLETATGEGLEPTAEASTVPPRAPRKVPDETLADWDHGKRL